MGCPICDNKPANCDCTATEREQFDEIESLQSEIARLREERLIVTLPMPFEPWRYGPLSYRKCEVLAALRKAGVKWKPLPPGVEGKESSDVPIQK